MTKLADNLSINVVNGQALCLGNQILHFLTSNRKYKLRIELEDFEGQKRFVEYTTFFIASAADSYRLTVGGYSGDAGERIIIMLYYYYYY